MTDNEIIQALYCCNNGWCDRCPYYGREDVADCREQNGADLLGLIKCQQAEIERLRSMNQAKLDMIHDLQTELENAICV